MENTTPQPKIHNVVATIQIECDPINIHRLSQILPYSSYDKSKFAAITIRLADPVCTCLLFTSGKLVVTGASSWDEGLLTAYCIRDILAETHLGQTFRIVSYDVQNIVAHVDIALKEGQTLNLDMFYAEHAKEVTYQRNMFPGLVFRSLQCPIVLLCFTSGKIVITGGKSVKHIAQGWATLWTQVRKYISQIYFRARFVRTVRRGVPARFVRSACSTPVRVSARIARSSGVTGAVGPSRSGDPHHFRVRDATGEVGV
jgi:transcription initiation factor TFIID TATA-box-binding protein